MISENIEKRCTILQEIEKSKIFAVVRTNEAQRAIDISNSLADGGIKIIEITMGYPDAPLAMAELSERDDIFVAAGSVITAHQAESAINAGAKLLVSPITDMGLIKLCKGRNVPIVTGAATPNEAYNAWKLGVNLIKIFPAKALGGPGYINDILTPMPFLNLIPTGGVGLDDFTEYLKAGATAVGMGTAFYEKEKNLSSITKKAQVTTQRLKDFLENGE